MSERSRMPLRYRVGAQLAAGLFVLTLIAIFSKPQYAIVSAIVPALALGAGLLNRRRE